MNTDGKATLCLPAAPDEPPTELTELTFPADELADYALTGGEGLQGFVLLVSDQPLPGWSTWLDRHGPIPWERAAEAGEIPWTLEGRITKPVLIASGEKARGEIRRRLVKPEPLQNLEAWMQDREEFDAVRGVIFPVRQE